MNHHKRLNAPALRRPEISLGWLAGVRVPAMRPSAVRLSAVRVPRARLAWAAAAGAAAAGGAAILPFYPPGLVAALGVAAAALSLAAPPAGLALALFAPVFPLGNLAAGAAVVYGAAAGALLLLGWRDARAGLVFLTGVLLGPIGAVAFVPLAAQAARGHARRALQAALAVPAAALVAGLRGTPLPLGAGRAADIGLAGTESAGAVVRALGSTLAGSPELVVVSLGLAAAAVALPYARSRGPWGIACLGAGLLAVTLLGAPAAAALPLVLVPWALCAGLAYQSER